MAVGVNVPAPFKPGSATTKLSSCVGVPVLPVASDVGYPPAVSADTETSSLDVARPLTSAITTANGLNTEAVMSKVTVSAPPVTFSATHNSTAPSVDGSLKTLVYVLL